MRGVITAPIKVISGAFTVLFSFPMDVELTVDDVQVETLLGDALGHPKDNFAGKGNHYHLLCYLPDARAGRSRISVVKEGLNVTPVVIEYDTVRTVSVTWGTPFRRGGKVEIPFSFGEQVRGLTKRNFQVSYPTECQLYGSGDTYSLVIPKARPRFTVSVSGTVQKVNGVQAVIAETVLEVDRG